MSEIKEEKTEGTDKQKEEYCKEHNIRLEKMYYKKNHNITWEELKEKIYGV